MNKEDLKKQFQIAKDNDCGICVEILMPNDEIEYIINDFDNLDEKLKYYLKIYDDKLIHKYADMVGICDVYPVIVNFNDHILAERVYVKYE